MEQRVKVGVGFILINPKRQFLLGQRKSAYGNGTWGFAGGKMEFGESFEQTAVRECAEECGIKVAESAVKILGVTNDYDGKDHYVTIFTCAYVCDEKPTLTEPDKFEQWDWFDIDNLPDNLFLPIRHFQEIYDLNQL